MDLSKVFPWIVESDYVGRRLDQALAERFPEVSRARWVKLIDQGCFLIQDRVVKASDKLKSNAVINLARPTATRTQSTSFSEDREKLKAGEFSGPNPEIIFQDADVAVVHKPCNLTVHPASAVELHQTLLGWLIKERIVETSDQGWIDFDEDLPAEKARPGIVHRLDKGTSGLLVIAKNPAAHAKLSEQFAARTAGRRYFAVVKGSLRTLANKRPHRVETLIQSGSLDAALRILDNGVVSFASLLTRDPRDRFRYSVHPTQGKKSLTHGLVLSENAGLSSVELKLETGRTHQIRVHLSFLGCPILGDDTYGGAPHARLMLHAHTLEFVHPTTAKPMKFFQDWPVQDKLWLEQQGLSCLSQESIWNGLKSNLRKDGPRD